MRNQEVDANSQFAAIVYDISFSSNLCFIPLKNANGVELTLEVSLYDNLMARINITEKNNTRYQLQDVLDELSDALR